MAAFSLATAPARRFFESYHMSLSSTVRAGNEAAAKEVYENQLTSLNSEHRKQIDLVVTKANSTLALVNDRFESASGSLFRSTLLAASMHVHRSFPCERGLDFKQYEAIERLHHKLGEALCSWIRCKPPSSLLRARDSHR